MEIPTLSYEEFEQLVEKSDKPTVMYFTAEWCGPCRFTNPTIKELADEYTQLLNIFSIDADIDAQLVTKFGIRYVPAIIMWKNGKVVDKIIGAQPKKNYSERFDKLLK